MSAARSNHRSLRPLLLLLAAAFASCGQTPADAQGAAVKNNSDLGRFVVTDVLIDPALDNMQQRYFENDPRLRGRLMTVEAGQVGVAGDPPCTQVQRRWTQRSVADLLRSLSQRRGTQANRPPLASDYGLKPVLPGRVSMVEYQCTGPDSAKSGGIPGHIWSGATGFALDHGRRALLWSDEVILLLEPATEANTPRPSFACIEAKNPTERAICADPALAGWDRSVAAAYALNMEGSDKGEGWIETDDPAALEERQRNWIAERNRCGTDRDCLLDKMYGRTDALMRRQY